MGKIAAKNQFNTKKDVNIKHFLEVFRGIILHVKKQFSERKLSEMTFLSDRKVLQRFIYIRK